MRSGVRSPSAPPINKNKEPIVFKLTLRREFDRMSSLFLNQLFEQFCKEKEYVKNSSPHTILFYKASYQKFKLVLGDELDLTKSLAINLSRQI